MNRLTIIETLLKEEKKDQYWLFFLGELFYLLEDDPYPSLKLRRDYPPFIDTTKSEILKSLK